MPSEQLRGREALSGLRIQDFPFIGWGMIDETRRRPDLTQATQYMAASFGPVSSSPIFSRMAVIAGLLFAAGTFGAEQKPASRPVPAAAVPAPKPVPKDGDLRIGLSPAAVKRAEHFEQLKVYRHAVEGDSKSRTAWNELSAPERATLLSELALNKESTPARTQAVKDIAHLSNSDDPKALGLVALARVAVADGDGSLRDLARKGLAARGDERAPRILATALRAEDPLVRANAAAAMKAIGGPRVFEIIIEHWKETWGTSGRSNAFFGNVRSYVADYDISGDSYDPVVRSFLTGSVIDAKVLRVESDVYYATIREVTPFENINLGNNPGAWQNWVQQERARLAEDAAKKRAQAVAALDGIDEE